MEANNQKKKKITIAVVIAVVIVAVITASVIISNNQHLGKYYVWEYTYNREADTYYWSIKNNEYIELKINSYSSSPEFANRYGSMIGFSGKKYVIEDGKIYFYITVFGSEALNGQGTYDGGCIYLSNRYYLFKSGMTPSGEPSKYRGN
ncbi:MAG: hypothetical protein J6N93_00585 [Clostridia bacterium]|nr:hypothetical protein [Clostridia bacterium]